MMDIRNAFTLHHHQIFLVPTALSLLLTEMILYDRMKQKKYLWDKISYKIADNVDALLQITIFISQQVEIAITWYGQQSDLSDFFLCIDKKGEMQFLASMYLLPTGL